MRFSHGSTQVGPKAPARAYNLFRNKERPEILCAVPEAYPIPSFLAPEQWTFEQALHSSDARPSGFNDKAADAGVRFNGFYLFQATADRTKVLAPSAEATLACREMGEPSSTFTATDTVEAGKGSIVRQYVRKRLQRFLDMQSFGKSDLIGEPDQLADQFDRPIASLKWIETRYAEVLQALPFAVYITDAAGRITFYNESAVTLWGRRPVLGQDRWCGSWRIYALDHTLLPHDRCPMAVAIRENRKVRGVTAFAERPDGTRVHFRPFPTPLHDANDNLVGALNVLVDIGAA
jgi:PAS domain-containing protein